MTTIPIATARKRPLRILLVEDHTDTLLMLQRVLGWEDYEVLAARGFAEGLKLGLARAPDLLIADLKLPDGSGWQLLARLREVFPGLVGVAASGFSDPRVVARSAEEGFRLHLSKPIDFVQLFGVVQECDAERGDVATVGPPGIA